MSSVAYAARAGADALAKLRVSLIIDALEMVQWAATGRFDEAYVVQVLWKKMPVSY
jgi:hypothetical protein